MFEFQEYKILKFLGFMWNPLSWVMEAAALVALIAGAANGKVGLALNSNFTLGYAYNALLGVNSCCSLTYILKLTLVFSCWLLTCIMSQICTSYRRRF